MRDLTDELLEALEQIETICTDDDPADHRIARILAVTRAAIEVGDYRERLSIMGAFNDE